MNKSVKNFLKTTFVFVLLTFIALASYCFFHVQWKVQTLPFQKQESRIQKHFEFKATALKKQIESLDTPLKTASPTDSTELNKTKKTLELKLEQFKKLSKDHE